MRGNVNRRVITSTDEFLDASPTGGIRPILVRPGAIHAELIRAHLGPLLVDSVYCSVPLALRGETVADRIWLAAPMKRTGSGQLNGEPLTPGNLLAFGGSAEVAGASGAPFQCGMLSIAPSALERMATALGIKSQPPGEGEFRVASVADRSRLSRAFDLLSQTVNHHEDATLTKREADAIERAFLEIAVRSLGGDSSPQLAVSTCSPHEREDRLYLRGLRQEMAVPGRDTRRPLRSVRRVGAANPLRLLRVLPDVAHRLPACRRAQRGTARTRRRTPPARCR